MKEARIAADDADADRAKTKLRRESLWMAKQPRSVYLLQIHTVCPSHKLNFIPITSYIHFIQANIVNSEAIQSI